MMIVWICFFVYAVSYIGRLTYNTNVANIVKDMGILNKEAGKVASVHFFAYAIGQIVHGGFCQKYNSFFVMIVSLFASTFLTLIMFFINSITAMMIIWGLNGFALSSLWSNCIKLIGEHVDDNKIDKAIVIMASTLPVGTILAYVISALCTYLNVWKISFIISTVLLFLVTLLLFMGIKIEKEFGKINNKEKKEDQPIQLKKNKSLWATFSFSFIFVAFLAFAVKFASEGIVLWMPQLLIDNFSLSPAFSILTTLLLPLLGLVQSIITGFIDRRFKNQLYTAALFMVIGLITLIILLYTIKMFAALSIALCALIYFVLGGVITLLTSRMPLLWRKYTSSGKLTGILNCFCYIGAVVSSYSMGAAVDSFGWNMFFYILIGTCLLAGISALVGGVLLQKRTKKLEADNN